MKPIELNPNIGQYLPIVIFGLGALAFMVISLLISGLLRPNKPTPAKLAVYESGEETIGSAQSAFHVKYVQLALIFLLFEVDIILLFPYIMGMETNALGGISTQSAMQLLLFMVLLALGLWYPWQKGNLQWEIPEPKLAEAPKWVPAETYKQRSSELKSLNQKTPEKPNS